MSGMRSLLRSTGTWRRKPKKDGGGTPHPKTVRTSLALLARARERAERANAAVAQQQALAHRGRLAAAVARHDQRKEGAE